ncbi:MAG: type II toxin-antitoxin system RelE/ParE family toxin [Actinomycetospora chiangmaiensis]|nr:type II toxin-antitoxin system RelE/ParE family toxin [Actinomycetospora chiangmaiensis]
MKVVLTERAIDDLIGIGRYIGRDSPVRAAGFVAELEARCLALADMPRGYPLLPGHEKSGLRRRPYRDYLIVYRIDAREERIEVIRVLSGSRDIDALLSPDE